MKKLITMLVVLFVCSLGNAQTYTQKVVNGKDVVVATRTQETNKAELLERLQEDLKFINLEISSLEARKAQIKATIITIQGLR